MTALLLAACFLGTGELRADHYDWDLECWETTTIEVDNWYWDEYTAPVICNDGAIWFTTSDGECWIVTKLCGDHYLDDPRVAEATEEQRAACHALNDEPRC